MKRFHIGIRVDEIVVVNPSGDEKFPTRYQLRNGGTISSTGEWWANVAEIERILDGMDRERESAQARVRDLEGELHLLGKKVAAKEAALHEIEQAHAALPEDLRTLAAWLSERRPYLRQEERECLVRLLKRAQGEEE